jgi:ectonucleotide pyrophosphatase/phosphodiesterase family protein 1/3
MVFWNGYFKRNVTPALSSLGKEGVRAEFVRSAFPTETFPNHFTIVTGLYPESHGIVDNSFYDKTLMDSFYLGNNDPKWWLGEPVWITAHKQDLKSGTFFWPGSEVPIQGFYPTYYKDYNGSIPFDERLLTILEWLNYPSSLRYIQWFTYVPYRDCA